MSGFAPFIALARPRQWLKNGFVFLGLFFSHAWDVTDLILDVSGLFVAFCLVSSAVYAFNDVMDRTADRAHPGKRSRPVASGRVTPRSALAFAAIAAGAGLTIAAMISLTSLAFVAAYIAINLGYSLGLKHFAVIDVFLIAAGFMLRILAGTAGVGIEPSRWLLLCGLMVTLFLGFAKRRAELSSLKDLPDTQPGREPAPLPPVMAAASGVSQRRALNAYSLELLDGMIAVTAAGTAIGYALYTIDQRTITLHATDDLVYTVPLVIYGVTRYLWMVYRCGRGADPSAELMRDPQLMAVFVGWLLVTGWLIA